MGKKAHDRLPEKQASLVKDFSPRTEKQKELINSIRKNEVTIGIGSSGTGKTFCTVGVALQLLDQGYDKIILIKSVTTIPGEEIGFIPGTYGEKMEPFMMSYCWNIDKMCGKDASKELIKKGLIEVLPIAYIRGLSIDNSVVIIDEAQNINKHTFKTIMTRIGSNSKYVFLGDIEQIDRKRNTESCLAEIMDIFKDSDYIGTIEFEDKDCVRNPIIPKILEKLRERNI